ncbi:MAG: allantoate amidohydrolase [Candidatus Acidiferrales bacterium]
MNYESRAKIAIERCRKLASFSEDAVGTRRTFLSPPMRDCHREIVRWLASLGVEPTIDSAGNLRGLYAGPDCDARRLLIGSHLDTVPNAGAFDGILGVVLGVALLESLAGKRLPFAIELLGFSEEEGVRFGAPFIGSRALVGRLGAELLSRMDAKGVSVRQAIQDYGLDPGDLPSATVTGDELGYLEFHIEQGPVLEKMNRPLAVVETIAGQSRLEFVFAGSANHAGTTPMNLRRDAMAGAAEWIGAVEREAHRVVELVATVGSLAIKPGAVNVIAGEARATLDVRHGSDEARHAAVDALTGAATAIAARRGLSVRHSVLLNQPSVAMDPALARQVEQAIRRTGCEPHRMVSGAGHDAMILAEKIPSALIFLRTPGGVSHDPAETVRVEDVAKAIEAGSHLLAHLAASSAVQRRTHLA